ncbi:MAG: type I methionyl aminopeptidase [Christensenellales bacterium]
MIKNEAQIAGIRESVKINVAVLDYVAAHIRAGISTAEIDRWVYEQTTAMGGIPAPLNYEGFPKSVCTSIDDQVCHGIPSEDDILCNGDIINVDCSTIYKGYYSDSSRMFIIGETTPEKKKLVEVTRECVMAGLEQVKPWGFLGDMGQAVHDLAKKNGYSVVRDVQSRRWAFSSRRAVGQLCDPARAEMVMAPGMMFTIEPMINMGTDDIYVDADNDWTIYTEDGMPSAQWKFKCYGDGDGPRSHLVVRRPLSSPPQACLNPKPAARGQASPFAAKRRGNLRVRFGRQPKYFAKSNAFQSRLQSGLRLKTS